MPAALRLACPRCRQRLEIRADGDSAACGGGHVHPREDGIWRLLAPADAPAAVDLEERYSRTRRAEGWGSDDPRYYRSLPFRDLSGRWPEIWRIRAVSFEALLRRVVDPESRRLGRPLRILDLGAGNGWLSARLAERGHSAAAVDLSVDERDGLGAWPRHVDGDAPPFLPLQATFDRLPIVDGGTDLAIFNGSFHYSRRYEKTLGESLRTTGPRGIVVILDTPLYQHRASGEAMLREQSRRAAENDTPRLEETEGFLTRGRLEELARTLDLGCSRHRPFYGVDWALRPLKNRLLGLREPMRFELIVLRPRRGS